jgi:hypothetical protein
VSTAAEIATGPRADAIKATWSAFRAHCLAMVEDEEGKREAAITCEKCAAVLWRLINDPTRDRHSMYPDCCPVGVEQYGNWDVACSALVEHLNRMKPAKQRVLAGIKQ